MDANAFTNKGNHDAQRTDTTDGITTYIGQSKLAGENFSAELHKLLDSGCPFIKPPHEGKGDASLVNFGTVTVPDEPGVKCKGGYIEISPLWTKPIGDALANVVSGKGPDVNAGKPSPDHELPPDWRVAPPIELPNAHQNRVGANDRIPGTPFETEGLVHEGGHHKGGADDHRRPYRPYSVEEGQTLSPPPKPVPGRGFEGTGVAPTSPDHQFPPDWKPATPMNLPQVSEDLKRVQIFNREKPTVW